MAKEGDFVLLDYTGWDDTGRVFDSTKGKVAKAIRGREGPVLIILGRAVLLNGLEKAVKEMKEGEEREIRLSPDDAFGFKKKELIRTYPLTEFRKHNFNVNVGDVLSFTDESGGEIKGTVKYIGGGRIVIDFNHPLAGRTVFYKIKVVKIITDTEGKVKALIDELGMEGDVSVDEGKSINVKLKKGDKRLLEINLNELFPSFTINIEGNETKTEDKQEQ